MSRSEKIYSVLITLGMTVVFVCAAAFFALNYNTWFVEEELPPRSAVSFSDVNGSKVVLKMDQSGVKDGISDEALQELNIYDFPTGDSPYFLYVEKGGRTLSVFEKDDYGLYTKKIYTWSTAIGKTSLLTPVGVFSIGAKEEWHKWPAKTFSPYATKYYESDNHYGGLFIHGPIYRVQEFYSLLYRTARQIGTNCSSGCLRTETEAAYFVYKMCPEGTLIKIVEGNPLGFLPDRIVFMENQTNPPNLDRFLNPSKTIEKIEFAEQTHTMMVGEQYTPEIITVPEDPEYLSLDWTTNNPAIIKISGKSIWAVGAGSALVTASSKDNQLVATMLINVTVHSVDTSEAPPDVGGKMTEDNSNITDDYKPISESLIYINVNGEKIAINQSVKALLDNLGPSFVQRQPAQSCAYDGLDRFFIYYGNNGGYCNISTVPMLADGGDAICEMEFKNYTNAVISSSLGIKMGDAMDDIIKAYGKYYTEISVEDSNNANNSFIRITYWADKPNDPSSPNLYFTLDPGTKKVIGMGVYSARNMG